VSDSVISPETFDELCEVVAGESSILAVGSRTKPPLSACADATLVSLRSLSGIVEYEPSEFTFTAGAGTTLAEISATLAERRQYLPFDPLLVDAGATIGGTVAAGLSGPGRFRFGGVRDFLLGVRFISGDGNVINAGGKVVKNAAGFDIPKFLVGSLGRFGVITELTFKVFPQPIANRTLCVQCESPIDALDRMATAASARWELDAIDYRPGNDHGNDRGSDHGNDRGSDHTIYLRVAGPERANVSISDEIQATWGQDVSDLTSADDFWRSVRELDWSSGAGAAVKVPTTLSQFGDLYASLTTDPAVAMHLSVAGNVLWLLLHEDEGLSALDVQLQSLGLPGLVIRGNTHQPRIGTWNSFEIESAVKAAMDPPGRFSSF
jgi:glycolate oxidase FAD binding subunit